jgi:hypothetical protein
MASGSGSSAEKIAQSRLTKVFKFLKELDELRHPVQRDLSSYEEIFRLSDWPAHPCITVLRGEQYQDEELGESTEDGIIPLARVKRAQLTACPKPPPILETWLKPTWQNLEAEPEVLAVQNLPDKKTGSVSVQFAA